MMLKEPVPDGVDVKPSLIPGAGLGAFATKDILPGTFLGHYMGLLMTEEESEQHPGTDAYFMQCQVGKSVMIIDAFPLEHASWTRFINCSRTRQQENVHPRDCGNGIVKIYSCKHIRAGTELLFYYGPAYAKSLFSLNTGS